MPCVGVVMRIKASKEHSLVSFGITLTGTLTTLYTHYTNSED